MLWLAWKLSGAAQLAQVDARKLDISFLAGMGMQFLNIKAWMLALAIVAGWVAGREDATARTLVLLPIMVVCVPIGARLFHVVPQSWYRRFALIVLIGAGSIALLL
jgi:threonine/homoserine/homoserine lactone efflux protein